MISKRLRIIIDVLSILGSFIDSSEFSKYSGKLEEQNRIIKIINKNKKTYPESSELFNNLINEISDK